MEKTILVKLGEYRGIFPYDSNNIICKRGGYVILEEDRSSEFGCVVSDPEVPYKGKIEPPKGKLIRLATDGDLKQIENNRMKSKDAMSTCIRKVVDRKLDMKIVKCEYTFDSSKIIFFFTSDGRVDFRTLVKDLARLFRVRIELRQIGVRDKSKIVNGYGLCGRELCCASYIIDFHPLTIKMAKEQGLPLNPSRISGCCGRIKCCMSYEYNVYREMGRNLPKVGEKYTSAEGKGKIIEVNVLKKHGLVDFGEGKIVKVNFEAEQKSEE
ncbi:MAG: stage 0 sporulation protein [Candidatus Omnitrophica bacterium]|nr:stage 0 sporulation protein [Candidatus Omnitrophota bacterium]